MLTELKPQYTNVKSFYRKATVEATSTGLKLYSYDTLVAVLDYDFSLVNFYNTDAYSNTTLKHVREFLMQNGFPWLSKSEILKDDYLEIP